MAVKAFSNLPITVDPEIMGGTPVFSGTRVPIRTLFDYLGDGYSLDGFLEEFPGVSKLAAQTILRAAVDSPAQKAIPVVA